MQFFKSTSINQKLTRLVATAVATALALAYVAFVINDVRTTRKALIEQMSALADVMAVNAAAALTFDDQRAAEQILESLALEPSIESASIFDAQAKLFANFERSGSLSPQSPSRPPPAGIRFDAEGHLNVTTPILAGGERIGSFYLHASMDRLYQQIVNYSLSMGLVLLLSFGAAHMLASRMQKDISDPILALARAAERISVEQDYSVRVRRFTDDELGVLYDEFNRMLDKIETSKRQVEAAHDRLSRLSQERMRAIVETAADGIITFTTDGTIDSCNGASCELLRASREELVGSNFITILPGTDFDDWPAFLAQQLGSGRLPKRGARQFDALRKDGTTVPLLVSLSEFPTGELQAYTAILRDMTEFQRLHMELAQAQKLESIGQLAAGIAHEINTPMQFIGDNIGFLRDCIGQFVTVLDQYENLLDPASPQASWDERCRQLEQVKRETRFDFNREQIGQAIEKSLAGVDRVIEIVRAMKQFSHLGSEQSVAVDLNEAIRSTATITRNRWEYFAELDLELDPDLPALMCLLAEVNQVLLNLVVNAGDAIADKLGNEPETKGRIVVRSTCDGQHVIVEVEDDGCGIPEHVRNRIFDPFFTTKEVGKGSGQGLAISHDIVVNKHHGTIQVESTPGEGTKFIVRLPLGRKMEATGTSADGMPAVVECAADAVNAEDFIY